MKKLKLKDYELARRLEISRYETRHNEKLKRLDRIRLGIPAYSSTKGWSKPGIPGSGGTWEDMPVPKVVNLIDNRDETCNFFQLIRDRVRDGAKVRLVFMETEKISSESLIYLLAQIHKLRLEHGLDRITGTYPKSRRIERLLGESGFLKILNVITRPIPGKKSASTRFVKCKTDTEMNGPIIPVLKEELLGNDLVMPQSIGKMVYRALIEAMANVKHHAYDNKSLRNKKLKGRWWLGAQISHTKSIFTLTFYDAGVGIPKTLHRQYGWELIRSAISSLPGMMPDDGQMIRAAVELGRTRTGKSNRGKGLMDIHKLIEKVGAGCLIIYSRQGRYRFENGSEIVSNDKNFIEGTLIKWQLPLDKMVSVLGNTDEYQDD